MYRFKFSYIRMAVYLLMVVYCYHLSLADSPDEFEEFRKANQNALNTFKKANREDLEDFRAKNNKALADFMKRPWPKFKIEAPIPVPEEPEPIIYTIDDNTPPPTPKPNRIPIKDILDIPKPKPQPVPISPIKKESTPTKIPDIHCTFYGTDLTLSGVNLPHLGSLTSEEAISSAYSDLSRSSIDNLIYDCLEKRTSMNLNDWAYFLLAKKAVSNFYDINSNAFSLTLGYILNQSGYCIRYAYDSSKRLLVLFTSTGLVYSSSYTIIDGKRFFSLTPSTGGNIYICNFKFPGEKPVSFEITQLPKFEYKKGKSTSITCHSYPNLKLSVTTNQNLIDFYNEYPQASITEDGVSKYAIYANIPVSNELRTQLYPTLRSILQGKTQAEAADILIKLAETFDYKLDSEMWGVADRPFFPDETWQYFYSDCEDHAIHFTRLIRDLLGLDAALVYYPGHLASAVAFTDGSVTGDYVIHHGKKYTICDPTIFYGPVGMTMPGMNNASAKLIDLRK